MGVNSITEIPIIVNVIKSKSSQKIHVPESKQKAQKLMIKEQFVCDMAESHQWKQDVLLQGGSSTAFVPLWRRPRPRCASVGRGTWEWAPLGELMASCEIRCFLRYSSLTRAF